MLKKLRKDNKGFTIIEVMIVLAIAGLIMLIVFLAVPALQRNSRNTARKSDGGQLLSELSNVISNANGTNPAACTGAVAGCWVKNTKLAQYDMNSANVAWVGAYPAVAPPAPTSDQIFLYNKASCNGAVPQTDTNARKTVAWLGLEGTSATACVES